jgi:hypothetical protein
MQESVCVNFFLAINIMEINPIKKFHFEIFQKNGYQIYIKKFNMGLIKRVEANKELIHLFTQPF